MRNRILYYWREFQSSLWFIPVLILLIAIMAASGLVYLDRQIEIKPEGIWFYFFSGSVDSARSILTIIAGAMIGVASTVFSITLVALTLASSQFGPRLLRNFMNDKLNQVVLGTYISTFIFCLLILRAVKSSGETEFVPNISVLFAILLAIANILLLILFIHHISVSIQADSVIGDLSRSVSRSVRYLFPEEMGEEHPSGQLPDFDELNREYHLYGSINSPSAGYIQSLDTTALMSIAREEDLILTVLYRPGDFVVQNARIVDIQASKSWNERTPSRIANTFFFGKMRTSNQDAEFPIHQMVEIGARALSPGVNDPYTAISCIDHLTETLTYLTRAQFPSSFRFDKEGHLRVVTEALTFRGMMDAAFNQLRQYGAGNPAVLIRLMEAMNTLRTFANSTEQHDAIQRHAGMILRAGESSISEENDMKDLRDRFELLKMKGDS